MTQEVSTQVVIDLPITQAWQKLRDISLAHHYVPGIVKTEIVSERAEGVGASRYVYRNAKSYIQETVEEWQDGQGFLIRLHKGDKSAPPFKNGWFRYQLQEQGQQQTLLTTSLKYELPWGPAGRWLAKKLVGFIDNDFDTCDRSHSRSSKIHRSANVESFNIFIKIQDIGLGFRKESPSSKNDDTDDQQDHRTEDKPPDDGGIGLFTHGSFL